MALAFDIRYCISVPYGILRLVGIIIAIVIMICMGAVAVKESITGLVWFTVSGSSICSAVFLILYIIHFPQTFPRLPWIIVEFGLSAFWTVFYFMSFITCCVRSSQTSNWIQPVAHVPYGAGAFFCLINLIAYGIISFLLFGMFRGGITIETTTVTSSTTTSGAKY